MSESSAAPVPSRFPALNWGDASRSVIQLRYGDLDAMGHVNNARYAEFLEVGRMGLSREVGGQADDRSVLARLEIDYVRDIRQGQEVAVDTLVERVGRTSWTSVALILADGVPCAFARSVQVRVDEAGRPAPLPDDFAARVAHRSVR
ncbi:thioesterase family protein [Deinococcus sp. JMULE3]|uniref:acyl-CoA thioesterase n=1 Tax=Deinococcus sp. JMULE3 TaxID=2518341 RepID=UPI001575B797|nr:thioesterase family protein [Deinococcus sp. JMULE3]NTY01049.1 acyl-CoA thioesterase [Deinococcus sp. JMULE3]